MNLLLRLPSSQAKLASELSKTRLTIESKLVPLSESLPEGTVYTTKLPKEGRSNEWLHEELERLRGMEKGDVMEGRVSGAVYHVSEAVIL